MGDALALGEFGIAEEGACGGEAVGELVAAEAGEVARAELLAQRAVPGVAVEVPLGQRLGGGVLELRRSRAFGMQNLGRLQAFQFGGQLPGIHFGNEELARGEAEPGHADFVAVLVQREQQVVAFFFQQRMTRATLRHLERAMQQLDYLQRRLVHPGDSLQVTFARGWAQVEVKKKGRDK